MKVTPFMQNVRMKTIRGIMRITSIERILKTNDLYDDDTVFTNVCYIWTC